MLRNMYKNREYTIAELTGEYRKLNQDLKAALQIFVKIHETWMVDENDYSDLTKLNLNHLLNQNQFSKKSYL